MTLSKVNGVFSSGIHCGIKQNNDLDLAYIYVPNCVGSAIVQSQNVIRSTTLDHNDRVFKNGPIKLMIINSGNANAVTGDIGDLHVKQTVEKAASVFNCSKESIGVASTGIIGVPLPIQLILEGLDKFTGDEQDDKAASQAILTTDLVPKTASRKLKINRQVIHFSGITKGSGMISPNMATTLGFITTDVALDNDQCRKLLTTAIGQSYNMISVDSDSSTNDLVTIQSSGEIKLDLSDDDLLSIQEIITDLCIDLAQQVVRDGEGAKHFIEVNVSGAQSLSDARTVAKLVVNSPLVKTAVAGRDPNWGRILMAIGKNPTVSINQFKTSVSINEMPLFTNGKPEVIDRRLVKKVMSVNDINIDISLGVGNQSATAWGCDLTHGYIDINTEYN